MCRTLHPVAGPDRPAAEDGDVEPVLVAEIGLPRRVGEQVAAADVDVVGEPDGDRRGGPGLAQRPVGGLDSGDRRAQRPEGSTIDLVAGPQDAGRDGAGVAPLQVGRPRSRTGHPLHGEPQRGTAGAPGPRLFEHVEQRRPVVPGHGCRRAR